MMFFYLLLIVLGVTFAALNASSVQVNFYIHTVTIPISVLMILVLGVGILIGLGLFVIRYWRLKAEYRKVKNQLKITEREIKNLRAIPLHDQH
jgi:putative membrane protein